MGWFLEEITSLNGSFPGKELGERLQREQHVQKEGDKRFLELQEFQNDGSKRLKNGKVAEDEAVEVSNMHLII